MKVTQSYLYSALVSYNYFPMVKRYRDETPKLFSSESFTTDIANQLVVQLEQSNNKRKKKGFDQIEYRTTRYTNVSRSMNIPVPMAYASLCRSIVDSWAKPEVYRICNNENSRIKPEQHGDGRILISDEYDEVQGGRVVVMEKDSPLSDTYLHLESTLGKMYYVEADISSFFPSIYSHAIPWALVGKAKAKSKRDASTWFNKIDDSQMQLRRRETLGVPVGPATSNIIGEIILYPVDEILRSKGYVFTRHIDDYRAYCASREEADRFILDLELALSEYLLTVNAKKIKIEKLPKPLKSSWVIDLKSRLPSAKQARSGRIVDYLDYAVTLSSKEPDGSVIKYAARALLGKVGEKSAASYMYYLLNLAVHYPVVLPILNEIFGEYPLYCKEESLNNLLSQHVKYMRSDAIGWILQMYYMADVEVPSDLAESIAESGDCMAMAALVAIDQHLDKVRSIIKNLDVKDYYDLDKNWILIHELNLRDQLPKKSSFKVYLEETGFSYLKSEQVSFLRA